MSLTPDKFFNGDNACTCCNKPMFANDTGIVYRPQKKKDFMFCMDCATSMTMAVAQDISRLAENFSDNAFNYYFRFKAVSHAAGTNLRRHAGALKKLAGQMEMQAESLEYKVRGQDDA